MPSWQARGEEGGAGGEAELIDKYLWQTVASVINATQSASVEEEVIMCEAARSCGLEEE